MRVIRISEEVWQAIAERGKFGETPNKVLERVFGLEKPEAHKEKGKEMIHTGQSYSLEELRRRVNLGRDTRPAELQIDQQVFMVDTWVDLCIRFVEWLIKSQHLSRKDCPISVGSQSRNKYFINTEPVHRIKEKDGQWKKVGQFWVDTKYDAEYHVRNLIGALRKLSVNEEIIRISFRD